MSASAGIVFAAVLGVVAASGVPASHDSRLVFARDAQSSQHALASCLRARAPLAQDSIPDPANFERVPCGAREAARVWRYDRASGSTRLARDIAAGEIVPLFPEFDGDRVQPGQMLSLVVAVGNVRVERQVEAMQAARPGQRLFVKSREGQILSVRYEAGTR